MNTKILENFKKNVLSIRCAALVASIALASSGIASAAAFDCKRALSDTEKLVCSSADLSQLDSQLATIYALALNDVVPVKRDGIIKGQRRWIAEVRDACKDEACLKQGYEGRIAALSDIDGKAFYVSDQRGRAKRISDLQGDMRSVGIIGDMSDCTRVITVDGGQDKSYGAICNLNGKALMVCNDAMIGSLSIKFYGFAINGQSLADFVEKNCLQGS